MYALCFFGYGVGQSAFTTPENYERLNAADLLRIGLAGATSAVFTTPILAPGERAKCVLQTQKAAVPGGAVAFKGPVDVWRALYASGGLASVNRGFMSTALRDGLGSLAYFSSYEWLKAQAKARSADGSLSVAATLAAGGTAGILNWCMALPVDTLKTRLQVAEEGRYKHGIRSVAREVLATEGVGALYRGAGAVFLRAFPANAACFLGYETTLKLLNNVKALDGW